MASPRSACDGNTRPWAELDYSDLTTDQIRVLRRYYAALVERIDEDVEIIINALRRSGQLENTIVVFLSDHGDYLGDYGLVGKTYFHEPSIRIPLIVTDFRDEHGATVDNNLVSILDIFPSILSWAGIEAPSYAAGTILGTQNSDRMIAGVTTH